jgi:hypothetical protein
MAAATARETAEARIVARLLSVERRHRQLESLEDGVMPFPGWEPFEGADSADLDVP